MALAALRHMMVLWDTGEQQLMFLASDSPEAIEACHLCVAGNSITSSSPFPQVALDMDFLGN
jgi:hypothetical protein